MNLRTHLYKPLAGAMLACLTMVNVGPVLAQQAPALPGSWLPGPDAKGTSTIVGRVDSPAGSRTFTAGTNLLVSGWVVDTTAQGWSGVDGVEVWNGARETGGSKIASGNVGLARSDIAESLGANFLNSGFSVVVPTSNLSGTTLLYVYAHTPSKGTWFRSMSETFNAPAALLYPSDPIVNITRPAGGQVITALQSNNKLSIKGYALDRNPVPMGGNPGNAGCQCGVQSVHIYMDLLPGQAGYNSLANDLGEHSPCGSGCGQGQVVNDSGKFLPAGGPSVDFGDTGNGSHTPLASYDTAQFGQQFDLSGWSVAINPNAYNPNGPMQPYNIQPNSWHTAYAVGVSSITGKVSIASTNFFIRGINSNFKPKGGKVAPG